MKRLATISAVATFFVMALVGWACDVSVFVCSLKALAGAVAIFVLLRWAGSVVAGIVASAIVDAGSATTRKGNQR